MAAGSAQAGGSVVSSPPPPPPPPQGLGGWLRAAYRFATDRNDFRRSVWEMDPGLGRLLGRGARRQQPLCVSGTCW